MTIKFLTHKIKNPQRENQWIEMSYVESENPETDSHPTIHIHGKLADFDAVDSENFVENCVGETALAGNAVNTINLKDNSVTEDKILNGSVTRDKIQNGEIITDKLAKESVTADKISWNTVVSVVPIENSSTNRKLWIKIPESGV